MLRLGLIWVAYASRRVEWSGQSQCTSLASCYTFEYSLNLLLLPTNSLPSKSHSTCPIRFHHSMQTKSCFGFIASESFTRAFSDSGRAFRSTAPVESYTAIRHETSMHTLTSELKSHLFSPCFNHQAERIWSVSSLVARSDIMRYINVCNINNYVVFCIQLIALMVIRKLMDFVFTQSDLYWLDHLLPDETRRQKEDEEKRNKEVTVKGQLSSKFTCLSWP